MGNRLWQSLAAAIGILVGLAELAPAAAGLTPALSALDAVSPGNGQLSQRRGRDNRRGRVAGTRGDPCLVNPGYGEEVWSLEPLFLWRGVLRRVALRPPGEASDFLALEVGQTINGLAPATYPGGQLQPGEEYEWWWFVGVSRRGFPFRVMAAGEERDRITTDLAQLQDELETQGADAETIAQARADYFLENDLLTDWLQALFSIDNPSTAFAESRNALIAEICGQDLGF